MSLLWKRLALASVLAGFNVTAGDKPPKGAKAATSAAAKPPVGGVKTPGVLIPAASLKAEASLDLASPPTGVHFTADAAAFADKTTIKQFDLKTNKAFDPTRDIKEVMQSCGGIATAFAHMWTATCGSPPTLAKIDLPPPPSRGGRSRGTGASPEPPKEPAATAEAAKPEQLPPPKPVPPAAKPKPPSFAPIDAAPAARAAIAASADSVWILADSKTSLQRIDPETSAIVADVRLPAACESILFAEGALWVACPSQTRLLRVDPATNLVDKGIEVSPEPLALAAGESSIWVLCRKDGRIARIDPKTNKVSATIELGLSNADGMLAFGEGALWASVPGFPVMRISPANDKVVQQFYGDGGGWITFGAGSVWVGSPKSNAVQRFDPKRILATLAE